MNERLRNAIEWFLFIVLVIRPSLDITTDETFFLESLRFNPASVLSLLVLVAGGVWFYLLPHTERIKIKHIPLIRVTVLWLAIIGLWAIVPVLKHGADYLYCLREWLRLLSYLPIVGILFHYAWKKDGQRIFLFLSLSFVIPAMVGLFQLLFHQGAIVRGDHRIQGTFVHPNPFAFYVILVMGVFYWNWRWRSYKYAWAILFFLAMILLIGTFSFTGVAMLGGAGLFLLFTESRTIRWFVLALGIVFIVGFVATPTGRDRIKEELKIEDLDEIERTGRITNSVTWRLLNWRFLLSEWKDRPWFGYGLRTSPRINDMKTPEGIGHDPHNDYVRFLTETGVFGLLTFLAWLIGIGYALTRAYRQAETHPTRHLVLVAIALYCAWLIGSMNDNLITATAYQYALWAVIAAACGAAFRESKRHEPRDLIQP